MKIKWSHRRILFAAVLLLIAGSALAKKAEEQKPEITPEEQLAAIRDEAPAIIARCRQEASEQDAVCIKGLYLGMNASDAKTLLHYYADSLSPYFTWIETDKDDQVQLIYVSPFVSEEMFNSAGIDTGTFVQEFINNYSIPQVNRSRECDGWEYINLDRGFRVFIGADKSFSLKTITKRSELQFD
jgi:hypothetical protein